MNSINAIIDMIATEAAEDDTGYAAADDPYRLRNELRKAQARADDADELLALLREVRRNPMTNNLAARIDAALKREGVKG